MANLGFKLLNIGFRELAREQCDKALKHPKPHSNVGNLVTALASIEENEKTHQKGILSGVEAQVSLLQRLGRAAALATPETIAAEWQGPDCTLNCARDGSRITLVGKYEREDGLLVGMIGSALGLGKAGMPSPKSRFLVSYSGYIRGLAVIGEYKREREGASLLSEAGERKMVMILSEDGNEITVIEEVGTKEQTVSVLKRVSY